MLSYEELNEALNEAELKAEGLAQQLTDEEKLRVEFEDRLGRSPRRVADPRPTVTPAEAVREFHEAFSLPIGQITVDLLALRAKLTREEADEAAEAVESGDLDHVAKELADLVYVAYGTAVTFGIDLDEAVRRVHASNMSKLVDGKPVMRRDGKVLKPPSYRPPDMSGCVHVEPVRREDT